MGKKLQDQYSDEEITDMILERLDGAIPEKQIPTFKKWCMRRLELVGYCFDQNMVLRCYKIWCDLKRNLDHFVVITGGEGNGKSTFAFQIAAWTLPLQFEIKNICYSAKEYLRQLGVKAEEYDKMIGGEQGE